MAVGIRIKLPGLDQESFDKVNEHVNPSDTPDGMIFHSSGPIDGGWGVIDFWESRAQFDAFFGSRVKAAVDATGAQMSGTPDIKEFEVHELVTA
jgi:quinol monooxygenase YgiN